MGIAHFNGDIVERDWVRAYALVTLASTAGLAQAGPALAEMDPQHPLRAAAAGGEPRGPAAQRGAGGAVARSGAGGARCGRARRVSAFRPGGDIARAAAARHRHGSPVDGLAASRFAAGCPSALGGCRCGACHRHRKPGDRRGQLHASGARRRGGRHAAGRAQTDERRRRSRRSPRAVPPPGPRLRQ